MHYIWSTIYYNKTMNFHSTITLTILNASIFQKQFTTNALHIFSLNASKVRWRTNQYGQHRIIYKNEERKQHLIKVKQKAETWYFVHLDFFLVRKLTDDDSFGVVTELSISILILFPVRRVAIKTLSKQNYLNKTHDFIIPKHIHKA